MPVQSELSLKRFSYSPTNKIERLTEWAVQEEGFEKSLLPTQLCYMQQFWTLVTFGDSRLRAQQLHGWLLERNHHGEDNLILGNQEDS